MHVILVMQDFTNLKKGKLSAYHVVLVNDNIWMVNQIVHNVYKDVHQTFHKMMLNIVNLVRQACLPMDQVNQCVNYV